jgi:hypothetical protein
VSFKETPTRCGEDTTPEAESEKNMFAGKCTLDNKSHDEVELDGFEMEIIKDHVTQSFQTPLINHEMIKVC